MSGEIKKKSVVQMLIDLFSKNLLISIMSAFATVITIIVFITGVSSIPEFVGCQKTSDTTKGTKMKPDTTLLTPPGPLQVSPMKDIKNKNTDAEVTILDTDYQPDQHLAEAIRKVLEEKGFQIYNGVSISGMLSVSAPETEKGAFGTAISNYTVTLLLTLYKNDKSNPCAEQTYKVVVSGTDAEPKEKIKTQGFSDILNQLSHAGTIPLCQ